MRIVNEKFETITEYDLEKGYLTPAVAVREDATPIDNITKFAWYDEDYENVQMYVPNLKPEPEPTPSGESVWDELDAAYQEGVDSV